MSKFAPLPPPLTPQQATNQWRAQQALEQVYPSCRGAYPVATQNGVASNAAQLVAPRYAQLNPGTPIHKTDEAVGVEVALPASRPTPIHRPSHWPLTLGIVLFALVLGISARLVYEKFFGRKPAKIILSGYSHALPVVDSTTPYPWEVQ